MMRLRVRAPLMFFAVSAAGLGLVMAACGLTDDLTGGPVDDGGIDGDIDAGAVTCGTQQCPYGDNSAPICVNGICRVLCTTNWGDCDDSGANGCETPLNTTTNCGRCAHDCLGGGCSNGLCQPRKLAAGRDSPDRIVLDNDYVYGFSAHTGAVTRVPKNGVPGVGAFPTIYREPAQAVPEEIAIANNGLYYTTYGLTTTDAGSFYGHVMYLRPDGGGHAEVAPALSPTVIGAMAVGTGKPQTLNWSGGNPTTIHTCTLPDCTLPTSFDAGNGAPVSSMLSANQTVYWANDTTATTGGLYKGTSLLVQNRMSIGATSYASVPVEVATDGKSVFFTTSDAIPAGSGSIKSCDLITCNLVPSIIVGEQFAPHFLAVDGTNVYWTTNDGAIKAIAKAGENQSSAVERILYQRHTWGSFQPSDIALDTSAIYFTDQSPPQGSAGGTLYKLAKP